MSKIRTHKDLTVWEKAINLTIEVYELTKMFPREELYGLTSQIRRCAVSIAANIAEGAGRNSKKEFVQFLYISLGSLAELETELIIAKKVGYSVRNGIFNKIDTIRKLLLGLIRSLKNGV